MCTHCSHEHTVVCNCTHTHSQHNFAGGCLICPCERYDQTKLLKLADYPLETADAPREPVPLPKKAASKSDPVSKIDRSDLAWIKEKTASLTSHQA